MATKNIFQRWKNGWRAFKQKEVPPPGGTSPLMTAPEFDRNTEAYRFIETRRANEISLAGCDWIPFDKYVYFHGLNIKDPHSRQEVYRKLNSPVVGGPYVEHIEQEMREIDQLLPQRPPSDSDLQVARLLYNELIGSYSEHVWSKVRKQFDDAYVEINMLEHYLRSQYRVVFNDYGNPPIEYIYWIIAGSPKRWNPHSVNVLEAPNVVARAKRKHYHHAIMKVIFEIQKWAGCGTKCCDYPDEFSPGVEATYTHVCRFKPYETNRMFYSDTKPKDVTFIRKADHVNGCVNHVWYVKTDKGDFPVVAGGEPDGMAILVQPFYRFEPGPEHGMTTCVIRIATGTPDHFWYLRIAKSFKIHEVRDHNNHVMECFTLPGDSPALAMFRIDCPLKTVL